MSDPAAMFCSGAVSGLSAHFTAGKIGGAVCGRHDDLAVNDRRPCADMPRVRRDLPEAISPIIAATGKDFDCCVSEMDLNAVAVELDFVNPAVAGRHLVDRRRQLRFDESGERRLDADRGRFFTQVSHDHTRPSGSGSGSGSGSWISPCRPSYRWTKSCRKNGTSRICRSQRWRSSWATLAETSCDQPSAVLNATTRI